MDKPKKGIVRNLDGTEYVPKEPNKLESLSTAKYIGEGLLKQVKDDEEIYQKMFNEQSNAIVDPRVLALHRIPFNKNMIAYADIKKELESELKNLQEEYEKAVENSRNEKAAHSQD